MNNNDVLRRLRYALKINDSAVVRLFALTGYTLDPVQLPAYFAREDEPGFKPLSDDLLERFLDGLIVDKRGPGPEGVQPPKVKLSNNQILRKLKIALKLKDDDLVRILNLVHFKVTKPELSALFRNTGHPKYRPCGNQFLRNFLKGLTVDQRT
jgi:uncharacterized protein YehS (DUF1456 family)